ncbi:MAG TPA: hypothetical protein VFB80_12770 [Pirellulaceae bacterium]|nr:hypothetical protein [Pirellulaceae bacterium]
MTQQEIVSLVVFVSMCVVCCFTGAVVRRWLLNRCFPAFRFEPWLFEPIRQSDLTDEQRQFFAKHTPVYLARGFEPLGDFLLRRDARPSVVRFFLSRDRTTVGELTWYLDTTTIGCMSVLLDGFFLESGTGEVQVLPPAEHGLQFFMLPQEDAPGLIDLHAASVAGVAAERRTSPAKIERDDVKALANYGRELSLRSLHKQGVIDELPAFLRKKQAAC